MGFLHPPNGFLVSKRNVCAMEGNKFGYEEHAEISQKSLKARCGAGNTGKG